jgi:hypothetical protein
MKGKGNVIPATDEERRRMAVREIENSVFTLLFRKKKRALRLYRLLNPSDTTAGRKDIRIVLVRNVIGAGFYNEIGFLVRDRDLYIIEAQTVHCPMTGLRMSGDWLELCREYVKDLETRQYDPEPLEDMLVPHFYAVYTGEGEAPPAYTEKDVFNGESSITYNIAILTKDNTKGILREYCLLASRLESERKGDDGENAPDKTLRHCLKRGILRGFILSKIFKLRKIMKENSQQEGIYDMMVKENREMRELIRKKDKTIKKLEKEIARLKKLVPDNPPDGPEPVPA